ncbi:MAG TPA: helix-hairpin-helix domain-containing protein [Prolixibacteraceae bacterium]|jgi:hypothetical protein
MMKIACLIILILFGVSSLRAQDPAIQQTIEDVIESMGSEPDESVDFQEILDDLTYLSQHPLLINSATKEKLQRLHFLSDLQIDDLIEYRTQTGQIYSIYEMASIEAFNPELLQKLEPFISFEIQMNTPTNKKSDNEFISRSTRAFSSLKGEVDHPTYEGSMERYYVRLKHTSARMELGMVAEKDPGEAFFAASNKYGFDYTGAYANFSVGASKQRIFVGDYRVNFGQGLVASQGFSLGKSAETTQVFHSGQGIRSSSSTDASQYFRGIAGQLKLGFLTLMPFVSLQSLDAKIDTIEGIPQFGAFQTGGYHRTGSEIASKNSLEQIVGGAYTGFCHRRWTIGFTTVFTRLNVAMHRSEDPGNQFLWEGKENFVSGLDWKGSVKNIFFFGEAAASANNGKALLAGILLKPVSNAEFNLVYRNINKTYFSFFSHTLTESARVNDEHALYLGFKFFPAPHWTVRSYADFFEYRWIKYTTTAPSNGTELFAQLTYNASDRTELYLRFFQEEKMVKVISENSKYNEAQRINRFRLHYSQKINDNFSLKSRIELSVYSKLTAEKGILVYQDLIYQPAGKRFSMNGRLAWFDSDGYNSRLYAYENDLLYSFSVPALSGRGIRTYLNFKQTLNDNFSLWLKVAATHTLAHTESEESVGSDTTSELKVQLRYQF